MFNKPMSYGPTFCHDPATEFPLRRAASNTEFETTRPKKPECAMNSSSNNSRTNESSAVHTVVASAVGLLPVGVVSGMMLMQILGFWAY